MLLVLAMAVSALSFVSCSGAKPEAGTVTRMTVDINPSVEFMIDDQNKIVSVTALNDDGSLLIVGESFIGKTPEEGVEMMVSIASKTGYLVDGNAEVAENKVKISVSGDSGYAEKLMKTVSKKAEKVMKELDIEGRVERAEALKLEELKKLALSTALYTEEEINAMDENQLCKVISAGRIETALLITEEMRSAYYTAKDYRISFAKREETARIIEGMGGLYALVHSSYKTALDIYSAAITELDDFRYDMLVSPDSEYQRALVKLRDSKVELLKQRNYTASLEINGQEYASATVTLQATEEAYNAALAAYEQLGDKLNTALEALIERLRQSESQLRQLEEALFDENIEARLREKATEIEANLNAAKDGFFAEFEAEHSDDIKAMEQALLARKQQLISEIDAK